MSAPDKCQFCGAPVLVEYGKPCRASDGSWVVFDCLSNIHAGRDPRKHQSLQCEQAERDTLAARVNELEAALTDANEQRARLGAQMVRVQERCLKLEAYAEKLEEVGDEMEPWVEYVLGDVWKNTKETKP